MYKLINTEIIRKMGGVVEVAYFVLDTSDFVVDVFNSNEILNLLRSGYVIDGFVYNPYTGRVESSTIKQGTLPSNFMALNMQIKRLMLGLQSAGATLVTGSSFNDTNYDLYAGRVINSYVSSTPLGYMRVSPYFVVRRSDEGVLHLFFNNPCSSIFCPIPLDYSIARVTPTGYASLNALASGGFEEVYSMNCRYDLIVRTGNCLFGINQGDVLNCSDGTNLNVRPRWTKLP